MKRTISLLLALVMIAGMMPQRVVATENPCSHTHDDSCYTVECAHVHDDSCDYTEVEENQDSEDMATPDEEIGSGTPDGTPPVLHGVILSAATVTAPGTVEITVEASDDVSGLNWGDICFRCEETGKTIYADLAIGDDGTLHGTLTVDQHAEPGSYLIYNIRLEDVAENRSVYYSTSNEFSEQFPDDVKNLKIEVAESAKPDGIPPVLHGVTLSANQVNAPGEIEITIVARDDVSGLNWGDICFRCEETGKTIYADLAVGDDGTLHGTLTVDQYVEPGSYLIHNIRLEDVAENRSVYYSTSNEFGEQFPDDVKNLKIEVVESAKPDGVPPVLHGVTLSETKVTIPGTVEITVDASDDVSGLSWGDIAFYCEETGKTIYADLAVGDDGTLHGTLTVDQYVEPGRFYIANIRLEDAAENRSSYYRTESEFSELLPEAVKKLTIQVLGAGKPDSTSPVLHSLELSATSVTVPESISFSWSASDDISGISGIGLSFHHKESGKYLTSDEIPVIAEMSGTFSGTITTDQYTLPGEYVLEYIGISDIAGNVLRYSQNPSVGLAMPDAYKDLKFTVANNMIDQTPPEIRNISLLDTSMSAPGEIGIIVDAIDEESGLAHISVGFYCEEADESVGTGNLYLGYNQETGLYHGIIKSDAYDFPGLYVLSHIFLEDNAENYIEYVVDPVTSGHDTAIPEELRSLSFEITDSVSPDNIAPTINGITFSAPTVMAPGIIEMYLDASDDNSGINLIKGAFYCEETDKYLDFGEATPDCNQETGKYHLTIEVDQYEPSGVFLLDDLVIQDRAYNGIMYDRGSTSNDPVLAELLDDVQFTVINRGADVTTSVSKDTFVEEITQADSDAYIAADYSGDATMPKEAFAAIAGTDKTIDLISEGITWRFEGSDITEEIKDIDLKVEIQKVEDDSSASGDAIENELNGNPGVVMKFPENGTLPGKATIQIKVDYAMREYLGSDSGLNVYYYNNQTGELELIASDLRVINDTYVEFPITHCSYYVLTPTLNNGSTNDNRGTCGDNLTWEFDATTGILTISGTGPMYDYTDTFATSGRFPAWYWYSSQVKELVIENGITRIGNYAFDCCTNLEKVYIPASIEEVGEYTFAGIIGQREYVIDQTVRQWSTVQNDTQYFPNWETTKFVNESPIVASGLYGEHVFWELDENGDMVFFGVGDMYHFGEVPTLWGDLSVKTIMIEEGITRIGHCAFEVDEASIFSKTFASVTIPSTVKYVGGLAFSNCKALRTITFTGNAPTFNAENNCFNGVTATAYYPAGNDTWTAAVMQNYDGNITWVPYCLEHSFGEWITEGTNSHRTCIHCGYTEHKVVTDSGDVEIDIPNDPDLVVDVDPVLPSQEDYILVEEALSNSGNQNQVILKVFDINLKNSDGVHVQPSGTVKVKLPLDWSKNGNYKVYRVNDDGTLTDMNAYRQGSHMVFETDHFSLYVIVEEGHSHNYQSVVTAPTCTEDGFTTYTCTGCGHSYVDDEVSSPGHSYGDGVITTKPTCMTEGVKTFTCGTCGNPKTEPVAKDSKNHSFTKYESDKNATCKKNGTKTAKCDYGCGKTDTVTDKGSKLGHNYVDGKCTRCGVSQWIPDTGDSIMIAVATLVVSGAALLLLFAWKKKKLKR